MRQSSAGMLAFVAVIIATGCGAFLNLSNDDDPSPVPPTAEDGGGESSSSGSTSSSSSSLPPPDAAGNGDGGAIDPDAQTNPDAKVGDFGLRVATFENNVVVHPQTGMDFETNFETFNYVGLLPDQQLVVGNIAARTKTAGAVNDSRTWYVLSTPQPEVDFAFVVRVESLPPLGARIMHVGTDSTDSNGVKRGIDLDVDRTGEMHFTATGNKNTNFTPPLQLKAGGAFARVAMRVSQTRGDARIAVTALGVTPTGLTTLTWPDNAPISIAVVGRVVNPGAAVPCAFLFDQVSLGPPTTIVPVK